MIGEKSPCITGGPCLGQKDAQPFDEILFVPVFGKDGRSFYPANNDMMEEARCIEPCVPGHEGIVSLQERKIKEFLSY